MPVDPKFKLKLVNSLKSQPGNRKAAVVKVPKVRRPSEKAAFEAFHASAGSTALVEQVPQIKSVLAWTEIATFAVCGKSGSALFLDIWDADHFDGFTDMKRSVTDCRAWFSADGFSEWGSSQSKTGRINCYFRAPSSGIYVCYAQLQSYPLGSTSVVECLIDNSSFGPLSFSGTINQPHPCNLSAGFHHFRIRQQSGAFFFLSLTVYKIAFP